MIVVTGAAGFIGSSLVSKLNEEGYFDIVVVDDFSHEEKNKNLLRKRFSQQIPRTEFFAWLEKNEKLVSFIFHIGARTDTTELSTQIFEELNLSYSKKIWEYCCNYGIPLVYASSAATYGSGEHGYSDDHNIIEKLKPLNPYGDSKNEFDKWALKQEKQPLFWAGLKFFNVYGPNEYHKGRMASVVFHAFNQIQATGTLKLFRSHRPDFEDGKQLRDFIYVKDLVDVCFFLMLNRKHSGIYNIGTGKARSFLDLGTATFESMKKPVNINFVDTPIDIRDKYQYFTEADMRKLRSTGYDKPFTTLEAGVSDYVKNYLFNNLYY